MYKETAKSGKKAIGPAILWIIFMYVFYILWGIGEILLEVSLPAIVKHVILWLLTAWFGWVIVSKFMIEYEFCARKNEFTIEKKLSEKCQIIASIKYQSIKAIYINKKDVKNYKFYKKSNLVRAFQTGQAVYMVYEFNNKINLLSFKSSRRMIQVLNEHISLAKEA